MLPSKKTPQRNSIAVIGMACEFPGAHSPEELWQNVLAGRRYFRRMPPERLPREDYYDPDPAVPAKTYMDQMAVISGWSFDPLEYRIPPVTVEVSDIAHWLALSTAKKAFNDAKLKLEDMDRARIGVVLGNSLTGEFSRSHYLRFRWPYVARAIRKAAGQNSTGPSQIDALIDAIRQVYNAPLPEITEDTLAGNMSNTIAGRICNYFDLGAGGYTIDGACSSSLLAVVHACNALIDRDMDFVLAGGVDVSLDPFEIVGFAKTNALATEDIRPYDKRANGMITGEGCGLFVLAREVEARAAGHAIYALIRGWGYSSDGTGGITEPILEGQTRALRRAYERSGYPLSSVGLIEGHGTGTPVGDKVEIAAIQQVIEDTPGDSVTWLGSIKANIGHCKAAAGAAGLTKAIMALKRKVIPPAVNCEIPNSLFRQADGRLRPSLHGGAWTSEKCARRASVSSMGFGGSNSHVTLEEADPEILPFHEDLDLLGSHQTSELILLSARNPDQLKNRVDHLIPVVDRISRAELTDLAAAIAGEADEGDARLAIVARSPWELAEILKDISTQLANTHQLEALDAPANGIHAGTARANPTFVALFPGQGSQHLNMCEQLIDRYPFIRELFQEADAAAEDILGRSMRSSIFREIHTVHQNTKKAWQIELRDTRIAQPAIVLSSMAILRVLEEFGLKPDVSIGHSLGEISALHCAGAYDAATSVRIAALRGQAMDNLDAKESSGMVAIASGANQVEKLIDPFGSALVISNYNSPRQTVVSGTGEAVEELIIRCSDENIQCTPLPVSHAFHSDIVAPSAKTFRQSLESITVESPSKSIISTATGTVVAPDDEVRTMLGDHIRRPVRFTDAVLKAAEAEPDLWVEVGPSRVLTNLVKDILGSADVTCLPTDLPEEDSFHQLNNVMAQAYVLGFPLRLNRIFAYRFHRPISLEAYNPILITNPCERPVTVEDDTGSYTGADLSTTLLPDTIPSEELESYIAQRGAFLREFIAMDYLHSSGVNATARRSAFTNHQPEVNKKATVEAVTASPPPADKSIAERDNLLSFAVDWISRRTGFPTNAISPEMKLREDLNLDSIKAGELTIILGENLQIPLEGDPALFANARLTELVDGLLAKKEHVSGQDSDTGIAFQSTIRSLTNWVRTFEMQQVEAPLESEAVITSDVQGSALVIADQSCPRATAMTEELNLSGLEVHRIDADSLLKSSHAPAGLDVLVMVLPEIVEPFHGCTQEAFQGRIEGLSTQLFRVFRWVMRNRPGGVKGLRGLIIRPQLANSDMANDMDAGAAFLKSLTLENPESYLKWVVLPANWGPGLSAEQAIEELHSWDGCGPFSYTETGQRLQERAVLIETSEHEEPEFGDGDIFVVSGGAKGITCELTLALAQETGIAVGLIGSSPRPDRSVDGANELTRNFRRYEDAGVRYHYVQCDVTNREDVHYAIAEIEQRLGPITGVLHGAGVSQLKLFDDKTLDDFLGCIRVKAQGLYNLLVEVNLDRIKAVHVTASVLGHTGMRGQTDYTLANAWLDGALTVLGRTHPQIDCLSVGYSVWADTGLGVKFGALENLRKIGVSPIPLNEGVATYLALLGRQSGTTFIVTGALTADLEKHLYALTQAPRERFLQRVHRVVPGVDIIADAVISHETDLYLREHVFEGSPLLPGVMAIEAMAQASMACLNRTDIPVFRNIRFSQPLIVTDGHKVILRTLAVAEPVRDDFQRVSVVIRSNLDGFQASHFKADCVFGETFDIDSLQVCPEWPETQDLDPESLSPNPLFQGKFFRLITRIRKLERSVESMTDILVSEHAQYYSDGLENTHATYYPAVHDALLQSGAIMLQYGFLPLGIDEYRIHGKADPEETIHCHSRVLKCDEYSATAEITVYGEDGRLLETLRGLQLQASASRQITPSESKPITIPANRVITDLRELFSDIPHSLAFVGHNELDNHANTAELPDSVVSHVMAHVTEQRRIATLLGNYLVSLRATLDYARRYLDLDLDAERLELVSRSDGKPEIRFDDDRISHRFDGVDISIADLDGYSLALMGLAPVGVDIELVEARTYDLWQKLLGRDGYLLAQQVSTELTEDFDTSATRVWTLLEAGKKANALKRIVPAFGGSLGSSWASFSASIHESDVELITTVVTTDHKLQKHICICAVMPKAKRGEQDDFPFIITDQSDR